MIWAHTQTQTDMKMQAINIVELRSVFTPFESNQRNSHLLNDIDLHPKNDGHIWIGSSDGHLPQIQ